ncbi:SirB1 family protein [Vibrio profundum]|uniref:SirB1 family protein n=1 Tax=Vibrio profundum TaxID=2910247 RepID=UPI003D0C5E7D
MFDLFDEDLDEMDLVHGALALNKSINPETKSDWAQGELDRLFTEAELALAHENDEQLRFTAFLRLFYCEWGFQGNKEAYYDSKNAFVDTVLKERQGIPVSLGAVVLFLGQKLGFPLEAVAFPTQLLIKVRWHGEPARFLNPFDGDYVTKHTLKAWLIGHSGQFASVKAKDLEATDNPTIIGRWLALIKTALLREEHYTLALRCTDLALTFVPDDPYEIRDRGFIYQQLDCHKVALTDYQYFIDQCPNDPAAELLKSQVNAMSRTPVVVH